MAFIKQESPADAKVTRDSSAFIKTPDNIILSSSMLPVDFLMMMVNGIRAVYYLSFSTYFCAKRLKVAISEDIVMRRRPFIRSRSSRVIDFGTNGKRVCTFVLVINSNFSHILHRFGDMAT